MVYNLRNKLTDTSSLRPQEVEPLQARQRAIKVPDAIRKPMDTRPSSLAFFASMLNGVANIGRTIAGVMQQNNAAVAEREYDKISVQFDQDVALLQNEDITSFPIKFDEILNRNIAGIDDLDVNKSVKKLMKAMLLDNSEDRAYQIFVNAITANRNQLIKKQDIELTNAIEKRDRSKANKIIYNAAVGSNAIFNEDKANAQILKANKAIDLGIVEDYLFRLPFNEAMGILNTDDSSFKVTEDKLVEFLPGEPPEIIKGRSIQLSNQQRFELKKALSDDDYLNRTAASKQSGINFEKLLEFRSKAGDLDTFKTAVRAGEYPGITENDMRDVWNKAGDIFDGYTKEEQDAAYDRFHDAVIQDWDDQKNVKHLDEFRELLQLVKYSMGDENYQKAARLLGIPKPTGRTVDPAKEYSVAVADKIINEMLTGKITAPEARIYAANAIETSVMGKEEFKSVMDYSKYVEDENVKTKIAQLASSAYMAKFKDEDGNIDMAKYGIAVTALRSMIEEGAGTDRPFTVPQLNDRFDNLITMLTKEDILRELSTKELEPNVRSWGYTKWEGDTDRTVKRLVTGQLAPLKFVDPGAYENLSLYLNEQAEILVEKDFPGKELSEVVELHENYMPIYRVDGEKYIFDVSSDGKSVVFTLFDRALEKYKNLAYGKPIGTVFEGSILTFDGYKKISNMVSIVIEGSEGYLLKDSEGKADYSKPAYIMAIDGNRDKIFAPIYTPLNDIAGVKKELENISEVPMSNEKRRQLIIDSVGSERYDKLRRDAEPRRY